MPPRSRYSPITARNSSCISGSSPVVGSSRIGQLRVVEQRLNGDRSSGDSRSTDHPTRRWIGLEALSQKRCGPQPADSASLGAEPQASRPVSRRSQLKSPGRLPSRARISRLARWLSRPKTNALPLVGCSRSAASGSWSSFRHRSGPKRHLALTDRYRDLVNPTSGPVALGQSLCLDHGCHIDARPLSAPAQSCREQVIDGCR